MNLKKQQAFNRRMGRRKFPRHQNLANGGVVKHFDSGGVALSDPSTSGVSQNASGPQGITGGLSNLVGTNNNFQASGANIQNGTNTAQLNNAYAGVTNALNTQQDLTNTLTPQAASGVASQNALAAQELAMTQGGGPNPALAQLNQTTGQNVANQAALMAGQRGASANAGLIAREAAQQGAATQQQAVGQGATLEAQQQIAAQQNLQNLAANQINQTGEATTALNTAQQNEQNTLQGANTSANNANVAMQGNINSTNAQVAAGNQQQNSGILGGIAGAASSVAGLIGLAKGGEVPGNPLAAGPSQPSASPNWAGQYMSSSPSSGPSMAGASAAPAPSSAMSDAFDSASDSTNDAINSYKAKSFANGANQQLDSISANSMQAAPELGSSLATGAAPSLGLGSLAGGGAGDLALLALARGGKVYHRDYFHHYFAGGGMAGRGVDAVVSPKEVYLNPRQVKEVVERGADPMKIGHHFPGKDRVKKDSLKNDVIKTKLEEGGVVLPIHITTHKDASHRGRKFVERAVAKHMKRPNGA